MSISGGQPFQDRLYMYRAIIGKRLRHKHLFKILFENVYLSNKLLHKIVSKVKSNSPLF